MAPRFFIDQEGRYDPAAHLEYLTRPTDQDLGVHPRRKTFMGEPTSNTKFDDTAAARFLKNFALTGRRSDSARAAGICLYTVRIYEKTFPAFAAAVEEAREVFLNSIEREMWRRAVEGTIKPIYHQGAIVGYVREYSDRLLEVLARGAAPEKYGQRGGQDFGGGGPQSNTGVVRIPIATPPSASPLAVEDVD